MLAPSFAVYRIALGGLTFHVKQRQGGASKMFRIVRPQVALMWIVSLLTLIAFSTVSAPIVAAAPAHRSKKSKKHTKKHKKAKKKHATPKVSNVTIIAGTETLTFNTQVAQTLEKAKVTVTAVSPAMGALSSGFVFPLAGGTLNPGTGLGSVTSTGAITFAAGFSVPGLFSSETSSTISNPALALNSAPILSLTSSQVSPPTFPYETVSLNGVHPVSHGKAITLMNLPTALTSTGAQFMNQLAPGQVFGAGEVVGAVTVQVSASN